MVQLLTATIDKRGSLAYFKFSEAVRNLRTNCVTDWVNVDYNPDGTLQSVEVVGFENFEEAKPALRALMIPTESIEEMQHYIDIATEPASA